MKDLRNRMVINEIVYCLFLIVLLFATVFSVYGLVAILMSR